MPSEELQGPVWHFLKNWVYMIGYGVVVIITLVVASVGLTALLLWPIFIMEYSQVGLAVITDPFTDHETQWLPFWTAVQVIWLLMLVPAVAALLKTIDERGEANDCQTAQEDSA